MAHFNLLIAVALAPAAFTALTFTGPLAWDGVLSFWVKNIAIAVWIVVMGVVLGQTIRRQRAEDRGRRMSASTDGSGDGAGARLPVHGWAGSSGTSATIPSASCGSRGG